MELKEIAPGFYIVLKKDLPTEVWFIRDNCDGEEGKTLLHICDRTDDFLIRGRKPPKLESYLITTGKVRWGYAEGLYRCDSCLAEWATREDLQDIWEDGIGTGYEGLA